MTAGRIGRAVERASRGARRDGMGWIGGLRRLTRATAAPHPVFWAATALIVAVDALWLWASDIRLEAEGVLAVSACVGLLLLIAGVLGPVKSDPVWRGMTLATAALVAFTVAVALLHYLAATLALPLADAWLARAEIALGFDWPAYLGFLQGHPALARGLALAYHSSAPQVALVVFALGVTRRLGRLWAFVRLFAATLLCVIAVSALLPALGPYAHYAPRAYPNGPVETVGALWHLEPMARLRGGGPHTISLADLRGLVTFPSFHVCLAVLTAWALAPVPVLGTVAVPLNIAVAVASLSAGGHYLPDVLAGGLLGVAALACRSAPRWVRSPRRAADREGLCGTGSAAECGRDAAHPMRRIGSAGASVGGFRE